MHGLSVWAQTGETRAFGQITELGRRLGAPKRVDHCSRDADRRRQQSATAD